MLEHQLTTVYGEELLQALATDREAPVLPEYPRPQLVRDTRWLNLNGYWDYLIDKAEEADLDPADQVPLKSSAITKPITIYRDFTLEGQILVPFSPESLLSGVGRQLQPDQRLWYRRTFTFVPEEGEKLLLHAGAVDQICSVWLNDYYVGSHRGGYLPFTLDLTEAVKTDQEEQKLVIVCRDPSNHGQLPWGKQSLERGGIWYTATSGIWQTIWLEAVPETYVESVSVKPAWLAKSFDFTYQAPEGTTAELVLTEQDSEVGRISLKVGEAGRVALTKPHVWSPEDPFLYNWELVLKSEDGEETDRVSGYCGLRSITTGEDENGVPAIFLNGKIRKQAGILDQGYWSDGLYTAPSDQALIDDIMTAKNFGFNMIRKHIKIEPQRWYYHCDRLGMLVWQDIVNGGNSYRKSVIQILPFTGIRMNDRVYKPFGRGSTRLSKALAGAKGRAAHREIVRETIEELGNSVSIVLWTLFNEGWGQFSSVKIAKEVKELDPTRLVDHASGWYDQGGPDLKSIHVYFRKFKARQDPLMRPLALTEFGGYSLPIEGHTATDKNFGYKKFADEESYREAVLNLYESEILPVQELTATVYTQLSDVEDEVNGLVTYDRKVNKWQSSEQKLKDVLLNFLGEETE